MPYRSGKIIIAGGKFDRRIKLTFIQKQEIKEMYALGLFSQRELARQFSVSRRLIQFIVDPEKHQQNLERRRERGGTKIYYNKEKHRERMKKSRRYKQNLFVTKKI